MTRNTAISSSLATASKSQDSIPEAMTISEGHAHYGVNKKTIRHWIKTRVLKPIETKGRTVYLRRADMDRLTGRADRLSSPQVSDIALNNLEVRIQYLERELKLLRIENESLRKKIELVVDGAEPMVLSFKEPSA